MIDEIGDIYLECPGKSKHGVELGIPRTRAPIRVLLVVPIGLDVLHLIPADPGRLGEIFLCHVTVLAMCAHLQCKRPADV